MPIKNILTGTNLIDFDTDTIKVALATSTYTPNQDTHDFFDDVTNEVSGTGYTAGGVTLATKSVTYDTATNQNRIDADDPSWGPGASFTFRYAIFYKSTGTASTSPLIGYVDMGADVVVNGTYTLDLHSTGYARVDVA